MGEGPGTIVLRAGTHHVRSPIRITSIDSGLLIINYSGEEPVLSGGVELSGLAWEPVAGQQGMAAAVAGLNGVDGLAAIVNGSIVPNMPGIKVLGTTANASACAALCLALGPCTSYTWHDEHQGGFARACLAHTDGVWQPQQQEGHTSGQKLNVYSADVSEFSLSSFAQLWGGQDRGHRRQMRARFPSANVEEFGLWTSPETGWVPQAKSWLPHQQRPAATEVEIGAPLNNGTYFPDWNIGLGGPGEGFFTPARSYWTTAHPSGGGGATYVVPSGFEWEPSTWTDKEWRHNPSGVGMVAGAYQGGHWGSWVFEVAGVDQASNTVTFGRGGFQEARGSNAGAELYVENVLEELDSPGEWFFDESAQRLYFYFNTTSTASDEHLSGPSGDPLVAAQAKYAILVFGSQADPVVGVRIQGLKFAHYDQTILDDYMVPSSGDYAMHRGGVIHAEGVSGLEVVGCTIWSPGGNGIVVAGYARDVTIADNEVVWAGESGIVLLGDCDLIDCTNGNQPRNVVVERNLVHEYGIYNQQSAAVFVAQSFNVTIDRLVAFNAPRQGTVWNDGVMCGHRITNSALFMLVRSTGDCGPVYAWQRTQGIFRNPQGKLDLQAPESLVANNVILSNWHSAWPIDTDDGSNHITETNNVLAWGGFKNFLGHSKTATNNVYIYPDAPRAPPPTSEGARAKPGRLQGAAAGVGGFFNEPYCALSDGQSTGTDASGWGEVWSNNTCFMHGGNVYKWGNCALDAAGSLIPVTRNNRFHIDNDTAVFNCAGHAYTLAQWQAVGNDLGSSVGGPATVAAIIQAAQQLLEW